MQMQAHTHMHASTHAHTLDCCFSMAHSQLCVMCGPRVLGSRGCSWLLWATTYLSLRSRQSESGLDHNARGQSHPFFSHAGLVVVRVCFNCECVIVKNWRGRNEHAIICVIVSVFKFTVLMPHFLNALLTTVEVWEEESFLCCCFFFKNFTPQVMIRYSLLVQHLCHMWAGKDKRQYIRMTALACLSGYYKKSSMSLHRAMITHALKNQRKKRQKWVKYRGVSRNVKWAGDYVALEAGEQKRKESKRYLVEGAGLYVGTLCWSPGARMSFQYEEEKLDFNYIFQHNQDVQNETESGGYSTAKEGFSLYCMPCILHCVRVDINQEKIKKALFLYKRTNKVWNLAFCWSNKRRLFLF